MSKHIFQATLFDPDVPGASAETGDDVEPGKSGDSSSDSEGQQLESPLKSLKAEGQTGQATEEDSASDAQADDQQQPPSLTAKGQTRAAKRGDRITPGGKNTIGERVRTTPTPKLWHSYVRILPT